MTLFLIVGSVGLALVIVSLIFGEIFEGIFGDQLDGVFSSFDTGGVFSTPVIGAFLAAFGFGGALILSSTDASTGTAALGGLGSGVVIGGIALVMTRSLMNMSTDKTFSTADLVGTSATVITKIPADGIGEISLVFNGQPMKLGARSAAAVSAGTPVVITAATSTASVVVAPVAN